METHGDMDRPSPPPTPAEAAAALREIEQTRASVSGIRTPLWFFIALGTWVAPAGPLVSLAPDRPAGLAAILGGLAVWGAGLATITHVAVRRMRVMVWMTDRQTRPLAAIMLPLLAAFAVLQSAAHPPWGAEAVTVVAGAGIIVFGVHHRLFGGRSA